MRVLLDEMMPRKLERLFSEDLEVVTVQERGWDSLENGELMDAAQNESDALVTTDRGIPHQRNLSRFDLAVLVLEAKSNRLADLAPLMEEANDVLRRARPGTVRRVGASGR